MNTSPGPDAVEQKAAEKRRNRLNFSAALLAGGRSARMGADKAFLDWNGRPLWCHQLDTLRACGAGRVVVCGRVEQVFAGARVLVDQVPGLGPLAGLERALDESSQPLVLVLAVDLPAMTPAFLGERLLAEVDGDVGVVPWLNGFYEPLVAVYPRRLLDRIHEQLQRADRSLQTLCRRGEEAGFLRRIEVAAEERGLFRNLNSPGDLAG